MYHGRFKFYYKINEKIKIIMLNFNKNIYIVLVYKIEFGIIK